MTYDATTPVDELIDACDYSVIFERPLSEEEKRDALNDLNAARAELTRRSELAAKYERLTRALAMMMTGGSKLLQLHHDGTPDGIADAYIEAAEGAQ